VQQLIEISLKAAIGLIDEELQKKTSSSLQPKLKCEEKYTVSLVQR